MPGMSIAIAGNHGCLVGDERILLWNGKVEKIKDLGNTHLQPLHVRVRTSGSASNRALATVFHKYPSTPVIEIITESGRSIKGTYNHPILVRSLVGVQDIWKRLDELSVGDKARVISSYHVDKQHIKGLRPTGWLTPRTKHTTFQVYLPRFMDEKLAALLGLAIADGGIHRNQSVDFYLAENEYDLIPIIQSFARGSFNAPIKFYKRKHCFIVSIHRTPVACALSKLDGIATKRIPKIIWQSKNSVMSSFLRWLFEGGGSVIEHVRKNRPSTRYAVSLCSTTLELLRDVQFALMRWRIHSRIYRFNKTSNIYNLLIARTQSIRYFAENICFAGKVKQSRLRSAVNAGRKLRGYRHGQKYERIVAINKCPPESVYDIEVPSCHRFVANGFISHNTGKSSLEEWLALAYHRGIEFDVRPQEEMETYEKRLVHWVIPKETVVVRDVGSFSWLALAQVEKLKVYIPRGAIFEPDERQVKLRNIEKVEYDPNDLKNTLFNHFVEPDAENYIHVIEYDCFTDDPLLIARFWKKTLVELNLWKMDHRPLLLCVILDEFQDVSVASRDSGQPQEMKVLSAIISRTIIRGYRKYNIRLIWSTNPICDMNRSLRNQAAYFMLKQQGQDALKNTGDVQKVWRLTINCAWEQVVVVHNRQPFGYNRFPFELTLSRSDIHVATKPPEDLSVETVNQYEEKFEKSVFHSYLLVRTLRNEGFYLLGRMHKLPMHEIARMMGYRNPQGLSMWYAKCDRHFKSKGWIKDEPTTPQGPIVPVKSNISEFVEGAETENGKETKKKTKPVIDEIFADI